MNILLMGILDYLFGKKKKEQERIAREKASMDNDMAKQVWEQFGKATNRRVITTGHLLFLQQLVGDAFFAYKHASDTSKYPSYMWADKQLFLGENSKVAYTVPFLWIRTMAKTNSASHAINEVINEMVDAFRKGTLAK